MDQSEFDNFAHFVTEQMARFSMGMEELRRSDREARERMEGIERQQERTDRLLRRSIRLGVRWMRRTEQRMQAMAEAQRLTQQTLQIFIDSLRTAGDGLPAP